MLMYRPFLLASTLRRAPNANLSAEEKVAVSRCRASAGHDINTNCADSVVAGRTGVWLNFQAVMVPLVSLFGSPSHSSTNPFYEPHGDRHLNTTEISVSGSESASSATTASDGYEEQWRLQIEMAIAFFDRMRPWCFTAAKNKEIVERLYQASRHVAEYQGQFIRPQSCHLQALGLFGLSPGNFFSLDTNVHNEISPPTAHGPSVPFTLMQASTGCDGSTAVPASYWGPSPNGDARMNVFWDDMMWDSFPTAMTEDPSLGQMPAHEFDWNLLSQSAETSQSGWPF